MFTSTCRVLLGGVCFALIACETPRLERSAPNVVTLSDGLVVAGAQGWCVDETTSSSQGAATVVIFGNCAALSSDNAQPQPSVAGIVTVSVENTVGAVLALEEIEAFLRTEAGRTALSRTGTADSVEILETEIEGDALVLHAVDRSGVPDQTSEEYWRGLFTIGGRVVTVSLVAADAKQGSDATWRAALDEQIERMRTANAV